MSVGLNHRTFANAAVPPSDLARQEVETGPESLVCAVNVTIQQKETAMLAFHVLGEIDLLGLDDVRLGHQLNKYATVFVIGGGKHVPIMKNGRGTMKAAGIYRDCLPPEKLAIACINANQATGKILDVLLHSIGLANDD